MPNSVVHFIVFILSSVLRRFGIFVSSVGVTLANISIAIARVTIKVEGYCFHLSFLLIAAETRRILRRGGKKHSVKS